MAKTMPGSVTRPSELNWRNSNSGVVASATMSTSASMMDPFDHSRCSFPIPDFSSEDEEHRWLASLTPSQTFEILHWMRVARWGEEAVNAPMDRSYMEVLSMEEFDRLKDAEFAEDEAWGAAHGWPSRMPSKKPSK